MAVKELTLFKRGKELILRAYEDTLIKGLMLGNHKFHTGSTHRPN